ncbi:DUF1844 domain-containing protein [Haliangium ochraceum]|uniref:DUF1844 domain-containing protein n=1 Tax=Haliangium ochraceum (strain DSM 14365 / JCM 11303 / SMP-2) TaxID=502025 RepID=D0LJZ1_HALO1|nr:DUF1844 domain-containing protein [Haliangium ochraceum]ACY18498.1 Domain of unknown function DUF1844 [Haliangium ochraceum DSM 14365]
MSDRDRPETPPTSDPPRKASESSSAPDAEPDAEPDAVDTDNLALGPLDFSTFILSLGSSAMVNLGRMPAPGSTAPSVDLPAAKQIIDILGILEEKTRGNLDDSEEKLIKSLLYDLRVQYVDAQQR